MAAAEKTGSPPYVPVVVIGAGESGIAMGAQLIEKLGHKDFKIYDRQSGIGGLYTLSAPLRSILLTSI